MWIVTAEALEEIAIGAGILGTGGGGNPYSGKLQALRHVRAGAQIRVLEPEDVPADAVCVCVGGMGAPTIGIERLQRGDESLIALRALERHAGTRVTHLVPWEVGGGNSTRPLITGALSGLPVVDADMMGRAFPELQMCTIAMYGVPCTPAAIADYKENTVIFPSLADTRTLERYARTVTVQMGGSAGFAFPLFDAPTLRRVAIPGTLALARRIGAAVRDARQRHESPVAAAAHAAGGQILFQGKVTDVQRRMAAGFARGTLVLQGLGPDQGETLVIDFQNENLIARRGEEVLAVVPDLITLVDADSGEPATTEVVRYGLRVSVLGIPAPALLKSAEALSFVGPAAFGYPDTPFHPLPGTYGVAND